MTTSVLVLGAGFGGLELSSRLVHELAGEVDVTLIDRADSFVFGYSKLDVMFGRQDAGSVRIPYTDLAGTGVRFRQETITSMDPATRSVTTDVDSYEGDVLVVALGADYDIAATPGLAEFGYEFYSVPGAERVRNVLPTFEGGSVIVGACGPGFKCPPAPSEAAILLDEFLRARGVRDACTIRLVIPFGAPVPPSPETSTALLERFRERGIEFVGDRRVVVLDPETREAELSDGDRLPFDLFLGIPVHRAPDVVLASELAEDGWIPVHPNTLATRFPNVYAVGDVTSVGTAKAGVFAERAARVVADQLIARIRVHEEPPGYDGTGTCYIELGDEQVGKVEVDFFSTPGRAVGSFTSPSPQTAAEKREFGSTRRARWFG